MKKCFMRLLVILPISVFLLCASDVEASTEIKNDIVEPTTWTKENSPYVVDRMIKIKSPLTIEPGVVVKFYDSNKSDSNKTYLIAQSDLTALGTPDEKIIFTSWYDDFNGEDTNEDEDATIPEKADWGGIGMWDTSAVVKLDNVVISYAYSAVSYEDIYNGVYRGLSVTNSELSNNIYGLNLRNVSPKVESDVIINNEIGIATFTTYSERAPKFNNNSIYSNGYGIDARNPFGPYNTAIDATYNWWGDTSGPQIKQYGPVPSGGPITNPDGMGQLIRGSNTKIYPWFRRSPDVKRDPVIFIPGIGASINPDLMISGILADNWMLFDRTYDGLIKAIRSAGYVEGKDFFIVYYDWRKSNVESAKEYLKPVINRALAINQTDKVNIIAHSMGGLVARSYVQSEEYNNDVNNLILIATPSRGSSDVYALWEGGYIPKNWESRVLMNAYISFMKIRNLTFNSFDVIHQLIPSLKELMPVYDYIHPVGSGQSLYSYLVMEEKNNFLISLNAGLDKLKNRTRFSIILGDNQPTVNKIPVVTTTVSGIWKDGEPFPIDPEKNDEAGDGEVLLSSSDVQSQFKDILSFGHREIVSEAEPIVMERLNEDLNEIYRGPQIDQEIGFWSDGPGNLEITDPDGNSVSKDNNNINDAKFSSETKADGFKIASVVNPKKGEYTVKLDSPNKSGEFHVGTEYADFIDEKKSSSSIVSGTIEEDKSVELVLKVDPENTQKPVEDIVIKDQIAPIVINISPEDGKEYSNDIILPISFTATDNVTESENLIIEKYLDDELFEGDVIDLSKLEIGKTHDFWINVLDEGGNYGTGEVFFKVKQAQPPIIDPDPGFPPVTPPTPPVETPSVLGTSQVLQSSSSHKSSKKKKSKHKKKSHKKKTKKATITKVTAQVKKILGISSSKNPVQRTAALSSWNYVVQKSVSLWSVITRPVSGFKNFLLNQYNNFRRW